MARQQTTNHLTSLPICTLLILFNWQPAHPSPAAVNSGRHNLVASRPHGSGKDSKKNDASKAPDADSSSDKPAKSDLDELKQEKIQLKQMTEALKVLERSSQDLIRECTQSPGISGELDVRGEDVIPEAPAPTIGGTNANYMPARPQYVRVHMTQLASMVGLLEDDIQELDIPDSEKQFAEKPLKDLNDSFAAVKQHFKKLRTLSKADNYDQTNMAIEAHNIIISCKAVDGARRSLLHQDNKLERKESKNGKK